MKWGDYWGANPPPKNERAVKMGDQDPADEAKQTAPKAPPSLRLPGETLPTDNDKNHPVMGPVQFPTGSGSGSDSTQTKQQTTPQSPPQGTPSGNTPPQQYVAASSTH